MKEIEWHGRDWWPEPKEGCIEWAHSRSKDGYGHLVYKNQKWLAHRLTWTLEVGPIPEGMNVLHHCDNPPCCLVDHLFLGTQGDNVRDAWLKRRMFGQGNYVSVW